MKMMRDLPDVVSMFRNANLHLQFWTRQGAGLDSLLLHDNMPTYTKDQNAWVLAVVDLN
jgi:hypothetical protein